MIDSKKIDHLFFHDPWVHAVDHGNHGNPALLDALKESHALHHTRGQGIDDQNTVVQLPQHLQVGWIVS